LLCLSFIIFFHELFHLLAAKLLKIETTEFSVGFGLPLIVYQKNGQKHIVKLFPKKNDSNFDQDKMFYYIRLVPLGGYVSFGKEKDGVLEDGLSKHVPWKRIIVAVAGPVGNFLLAFLVTIPFLLFTFSSISIVNVKDHSPAQEKFKLESGIFIKKINGEKVNAKTTLTELLVPNKTNCIFVIGGQQSGNVCNKLTKDDIGEFGASTKSVFGTISWKFDKSNVIYQSARTVYFMSGNYISGVWDVITNGKIKDLSGPVGIINAMQQQVVDIYYFTMIVIIINVALAVANLLFPLSITDGGRIFLDILAILFRKHKLNTKYLDITSALVMLILFVFVTCLDVMHIFFK
jgi:regulator of sigma E protease